MLKFKLRTRYRNEAAIQRRAHPSVRESFFPRPPRGAKAIGGKALAHAEGLAAVSMQARTYTRNILMRDIARAIAAAQTRARTRSRLLTEAVVRARFPIIAIAHSFV